MIRRLPAAALAAGIVWQAGTASAVTFDEFDTWPRARQDDYMVALVYDVYDTLALFDRPDLYACLRSLVGTPHGGAFDDASAGMLRVRADLAVARESGPAEAHVEDAVRASLFRLLNSSCA